jgi:hypothetical protein
MSVTSFRNRRLLIAFAAPALLAAVVPLALAQTNGAAQRFTAIAVNMSNIGRAGEGIFEIVVNRWSTEAERDRLLTTGRQRCAGRLRGSA